MRQMFTDCRHLQLTLGLPMRRDDQNAPDLRNYWQLKTILRPIIFNVAKQVSFIKRSLDDEKVHESSCTFQMYPSFISIHFHCSPVLSPILSGKASLQVTRFSSSCSREGISAKHCAKGCCSSKSNGIGPIPCEINLTGMSHYERV